MVASTPAWTSAQTPAQTSVQTPPRADSFARRDVAPVVVLLQRDGELMVRGGGGLARGEGDHAFVFGYRGFRIPQQPPATAI